MIITLLELYVLDFHASYVLALSFLIIPLAVFSLKPKDSNEKRKKRLYYSILLFTLIYVLCGSLILRIIWIAFACFSLSIIIPLLVSSSEATWRLYHRKELKLLDRKSGKQKEIRIYDIICIAILSLIVTGLLLYVAREFISHPLSQIFITVSPYLLIILYSTYFLMVPIIVFSVKPEDSEHKRRQRLLIAAWLYYILMTGTMLLHAVFLHILDITGLFLSKSILSIASDTMSFHIFFGWFFGVTITGLSEIAWRIYYYKTLKALPPERKQNPTARWMIIIAVPIAIIMLLNAIISIINWIQPIHQI